MKESAIFFSGEESSRFSRFAQFLLSNDIPCTVSVEGRDPLTSRRLTIQGRPISATVESYLRYVVVKEYGSEIEFWIAGSNAIRSVATKSINFRFETNDYSRLLRLARDYPDFLPGMVSQQTGASGVWRRLDSAPSTQNSEELAFLLQCLQGNDIEAAREAALDLRAFSTFVTSRKSEQIRTETRLLSALVNIEDIDTKVAVAEDLGYVGTSASIAILSQLATDRTAHMHVRWAAGVALSRLPGDQVIGALVDLVHTSTGWPAAGALLGLSRHAEPGNQAVLEPVFAEHLISDIDPVLQRYACLGLSRFEALSEQTANLLLELLTTQDRELNIRGFAALSFSSALHSITRSSRDRLCAAITDISNAELRHDQEPESVWALEFTAELATLLELNGPAAKLHQQLATQFDDWRSGYYNALAAYELADAKCRDGRSIEALELLHDSAAYLANLSGINEADEEAIRFRLEIVRARVALQEVIHSWQTTIDYTEISSVANDLDAIGRVYERYIRPSRMVAAGIKQLSQRETEYLRKTRQLLQILKLAMQFDATVHARPGDIEAIKLSLFRLSDGLSSLQTQLTGGMSEGHQRVVSATARLVDRLRLALSLQLSQPGEQEEALLAGANELKAAFGAGTWPMPARACPVGGLGRGSISVLREDVPGEGAPDLPYLFPKDAPAVLNVVAVVEDMAPGGTTSAQLICSVGGSDLQQMISAVEGAVRVTFVLPDVLSSATSTRCELQLVFYARDCRQIGATKSIYLRRQQ